MTPGPCVCKSIVRINQVIINSFCVIVKELLNSISAVRVVRLAGIYIRHILNTLQWPDAPYAGDSKVRVTRHRG